MTTKINKEQSNANTNTNTNTNQYGTTDGKPQVRNINRASQRIINEFHSGSDPQAKNLRNRDMFATLDHLVNRTRTGSFFQDFSLTRLDRWDKRCADAVDSAIKNGETKEENRNALESGCFGITHSQHRQRIMNEYEQDRKAILEERFDIHIPNQNSPKP